jgi:GT2 family glycosyltransferase
VVRGPRVVTVVLNYRHYEDTQRCVASLQESTFLNHHILVVDNTEPAHKWDGFRPMLDPWVDLIDGGGNNGFAAGANIGIGRALELGAEFVWLVNPDVAVAPDTLAVLVETAERHSDAGVVGCRIVNEGHPPRILFNGGVVDAARGGATSYRDQGAEDGTVPDELLEVDYVIGACSLVRRSVLRRVGLMPEEYFLYFEATDWCMRIGAAGWRMVVAPGTRVLEFKQSTDELLAPYYIYYMLRNRVHFSKRFFDADFEATKADLSPIVERWRDKVDQRAPDQIGTFDKVVEIAFSDARAGRLGRRDDIHELALA